jgi:CheY-like chemotaxis protein
MTDSQPPASKSTIMVVDDEKDMVNLVKTMLEEKGYGVQSANSGQEVFNLLGEQKPDLIILDVFMPQMDGLEVLVRLRENPATASIPVILLTTNQEYKDILEGYQKGTNYYIPKPFTKNQLLDGVNSILS